ncbi:AIG1 domain protein, putative [Rhizoctonia solani AG-3 Rhs1AP]|uniref:AIG1 domain protein, putative n=2 Tax=Rhizoctonia solani AG-3 TaxID=1086053 RepID=X8J8H2_9AGAM|nr:AIG1 domain protein, putative [Rhizoctonia solani AG-3 Rhs1AP]KEP46044.1 putative AIG1 domain protein [Rhizoctonia solani 123E]
MSSWLKRTYNNMQQSLAPNEQSLVEPTSLSTNTFDHAINPPRTIYILFVGRFGCGKTELINIWSGSGHYHSGHGEIYSLINSTSFDVPNWTDIDVHTEIARLLSQYTSRNEQISGIIYCHPLMETLSSGATQRNLRALIELFLGRQEMHRLTILVLPSSATDTKAEKVVEWISNHTTSFDEAVIGGAVVAAGGWTKHDMAKHLQRYCSMAPFCPPVCQPIAGHGTQQQLVEKALGYYGRQTIESYAQSLQQLTQDKEALEAQVTRYQTKARQADSQHSAISRTPREDEYERLRRAERDYASLRSQVQLQIGYEQGAIVQNLKEINDMIEHLGDSISEYLVDTYGERAFNKGAAGATILDARDLHGLRAWLRQHQGQMSLYPSPENYPNKHLSVDNFLIFLVRSRLCNILNDKVFKPFHPFIEPTENLRLTEYYEKIQKQEQQYTAGKWRSITFQMLCTTLRRTEEEQMEAIAQEFMDNFLEPLAKYLFGLAEISLEECHFDDLRRVIKKAWEWTSRLKTEVIMLGDFYPTMCVPGLFDSASAMEFEVSSRRSRPKLALCTLGFGLVSRQAKGGGQSPSETIILKTSVLADSYYIST